MNIPIIIVFLSYSINPFVRKFAIMNLNSCTGYTLLQGTTLAGNIVYLYLQKDNLQIKDITPHHIQYSILSSALTILSSYQMTTLIKTCSMANLTTKVQVLTIVSTYIVDYIINHNRLTMKDLFGIVLMLSGIMIIER